MFKIITVIEKHYVRTEFFKTFPMKHSVYRSATSHVLNILNVLHNGIQGPLEYAANVGLSADGSDQGEISRVSIAIAISLTIPSIPILVGPCVVAIVGVISVVSAQPLKFMKSI